MEEIFRLGLGILTIGVDWVIRLNPLSACGNWAYREGKEFLPCCLFKGSYPVFKLILEKTTENFERLGRQERPGIQPANSHLPVFSATGGAFEHWKIKE